MEDLMPAEHCDVTTVCRKTYFSIERMQALADALVVNGCGERKRLLDVDWGHIHHSTHAAQAQQSETFFICVAPVRVR